MFRRRFVQVLSVLLAALFVGSVLFAIIYYAM